MVDGTGRLGAVVDDGIVSLTDALPGHPTDMQEFIASWAGGSILDGIPAGGVRFGLDDVQLAPPVKPTKIVCTGLNYTDHIREANLEPPDRPAWFPKMPNTVTAPFGPVPVPRVSEQLDYEGELVVVVGRRASGVSDADAPQYIFGYCVGNDYSVRDWQFRTPQAFLGKNFDGTCVFGPWLTTNDEVDADNLEISTCVNGEKRQSSNTSYLLYNCGALLSYVSQVMTLEPGDLIFTGTPSGVGAFRDPPAWLRPGDRVRVEIDRLGAIENQIVAGP